MRRLHLRTDGYDGASASIRHGQDLPALDHALHQLDEAKKAIDDASSALSQAKSMHLETSYKAAQRWLLAIKHQLGEVTGVVENAIHDAKTGITHQSHGRSL